MRRAPGVGDADCVCPAHGVQGPLFPSAHRLAFSCPSAGCPSEIQGVAPRVVAGGGEMAPVFALLSPHSEE